MNNKETIQLFCPRCNLKVKFHKQDYKRGEKYHCGHCRGRGLWLGGMFNDKYMAKVKQWNKIKEKNKALKVKS